MGKTIYFEMANEIKMTNVKKWLKKRLKRNWTDKQLNDFIINTLLNQYETSQNIIARIECYWENH